MHFCLGSPSDSDGSTIIFRCPQSGAPGYRGPSVEPLGHPCFAVESIVTEYKNGKRAEEIRWRTAQFSLFQVFKQPENSRKGTERWFDAQGCKYRCKWPSYKWWQFSLHKRLYLLIFPGFLIYYWTQGVGRVKRSDRVLHSLGYLPWPSKVWGAPLDKIHDSVE